MDKKIKISVDDAHIDQIDAVVNRLEKLGVTVSDYDDLGIVTGSVPSSQFDRVQSVEGVAHVSEQREFQLAPRSSKVQ